MSKPKTRTFSKLTVKRKTKQKIVQVQTTNSNWPHEKKLHEELAKVRAENSIRTKLCDDLAEVGKSRLCQVEALKETNRGLEFELNDMRVSRDEAREELTWAQADFADLQENAQRIYTEYLERGMAMRDTGNVVRALYNPKVDKLVAALDQIAILGSGPAAYTKDFTTDVMGIARKALEEAKRVKFLGEKTGLKCPNCCPQFDAYYKTCEVENGQLLDRIKELEAILEKLVERWKGTSYSQYDGIFVTQLAIEAFEVLEKK
jgi:hypothetical protein